MPADDAGTSKHVAVFTVCKTLLIYEGSSESKERLRIQPAQLFHCTRSVLWCVQ
jgi:hypothetical protein